MSRNRTTVPTYHKHSSGRARIRIYGADGKRVEYILPGEYGSKESKEAYAKLLLQMKAGTDSTFPVPIPEVSVAERVLRFMEHAESYYTEPGKLKMFGKIASRNHRDSLPSPPVGEGPGVRG